MSILSLENESSCPLVPVASHGVFDGDTIFRLFCRLCSPAEGAIIRLFLLTPLALKKAFFSILLSESNNFFNTPVSPRMESRNAAKVFGFFLV